MLVTDLVGDYLDGPGIDNNREDGIFFIASFK